MAMADAGLHPADGGGVGCRDYPDLGFRVFPVLQDDPSYAEGLPLCTPSCHPHLGRAGTALAPSNQDLPSGPCDDEGAACVSALTSDSCGVCRYSGGSGSGYRCACRNHRWQCAIASQGGASCAPPECLAPDGGFVDNCYFTQSRTATQICVCGMCHQLCTKDADCTTGTCQVDTLCIATLGCSGPDECTSPCTGFCK